MTTTENTTRPTEVKLTRRNMLKTAAAISAAALLPTHAVATAHKPGSLDELNMLFDAHAEAVERDNAMWDLVGEWEGHPLMQARPIARVQVGRLLKGWRDDDGNDVYEPIYAYSAEGIDKSYKPHTEAMLALHARTPAQRESLMSKRAETVRKKKDELLRLQREIEIIERDCGYTAAVDDAKAASDAVKAIEQQIVSLVPSSLEVAARQAEWIIEAYKVNEDVTYLEQEHLLKALTAISAASPGGARS